MHPFLALFLCLPAFAQTLDVTQGLVNDQVLQRGPGNRATARFSGAAAARLDGANLEGRAVNAKGGEQVLDWTPLGKIDGGKWTAELAGIPNGGPYRIELRAGDATAQLTGILAGDLWVLAGQSNMEGVGDLVNVTTPMDQAHSFDQSDHWGIAKEPLHSLPDAVDRVHWRKNAAGEPELLTGPARDKWIADRKKGAGLGLPFAQNMLARTHVPIGLIPCAHGGTSMDQWSPDLKDKDKEGDSLYGAMLRRIHAAGGKVTGILWYQGESDANPKDAPAFQAKFVSFVAALRKDLGQPDLPFYYVQIGRHIDRNNLAEWNAIQGAQLKAEALIPRSGLASSVDLSLDDGIHISTPDLQRLGQRLALLAGHDVFPEIRGYPLLMRGPRPVSAKFEDGAVTVKFSDVNGGLVALGRVSGFSIHTASGEPVPAIYKARFDPADRTIVHLDISGKLPEGAVLWYGYGKDPYCNIRDYYDMAVPVFGPMPIE
jgi:sialate O-acetylesterase